MPIGIQEVTFPHAHPKVNFFYFSSFISDIIVFLVILLILINFCIHLLIPQIFNDKYFLLD